LFIEAVESALDGNGGRSTEVTVYRSKSTYLFANANNCGGTGAAANLLPKFTQYLKAALRHQWPVTNSEWRSRPCQTAGKSPRRTLRANPL
jgi:hypothetical protein